MASAGDVNGDGYGDVIVGAPQYDVGHLEDGAAFVFHGSATGVADATEYEAASRIECDEEHCHLGESVASAGDVNGDGYGDVIVGAPDYGYSGAIFVHLGSADGIAGGLGVAIELLPEIPEYSSAGVGTSVAGAGDVNGDGYGDVIVGVAGTWPNYAGYAYVIRGGPDGIDTSPPTTYLAVGPVVAGAGDVNGDGYADVIVGDSDYFAGQLDEGAAFVFHGSASGISGAPANAAARIESDQASAFLGESVVGAGDVNGDGYADVIVGARLYDAGQSNEGAAFVFHGGAAGIGNRTPASADAQLESNFMNYGFARSVSGAGDVNGDGYADVILRGGLDGYVFLGGAAGIPSGGLEAAAATLASGSNDTAVAGAGDVDGDGFADVMLRSDEDVYLFHGGDGRPVRAQQLRRVSKRVAPWGTARENAFRIRSTATHPEGRGRVKLEVEACPVGVPFFAAGCEREISPSWTSVPATGSGVELELGLSDLADDSLYRWRARVLHAPLTIAAPASPAHGPWRRPTAQSFEADIRTGSSDVDGDTIPNETDPDDDGDELPDAAETGTGVFVSPTDTGSDPLDPDSDGDGFWDGWEVAIQADPNDPADPDAEDSTSNGAIQASDQPKYRWRYGTGGFSSEFVVPSPFDDGDGICSIAIPSAGGDVSVTFRPASQQQTSGSVCCTWESVCELTCADNACDADVCPPKDDQPECLPGMTCVDASLDCGIDQTSCNVERDRLLAAGVPPCCFQSAGSTYFEWSPSGVQGAPDTDADRVPDPCDNCVSVDNPRQADLDEDGTGDACDAALLLPSCGSTDSDADGVGDVCDTEPPNADHCTDTDADSCDDCSSGYFNTSTDHVICLPEPGAVTSLVAAIALLRALGLRRGRRGRVRPID
jgi:hypothetical protein